MTVTSRRRRSIPRLMGAAEVAECLGIFGQNLAGKNVPRGLPEPVAEVRATRLWLADEIEAFAVEFNSRRRGSR